MYGSQVWTPKLLAGSETILKVQKYAMRIIKFTEFKAHTEPLFKELSILKFIQSNFIKKIQAVNIPPNSDYRDLL